MPDIEFLPESAGIDVGGEELGGIGWVARLLTATAGLAAWVVAGAAVMVALTRGTPVAAPPIVSYPPPARPVVAASVAGLRPVFVGAYSDVPVLSVAVAGSSVWLLQADGLYVVSPSGDGRIRLALPLALQDARLVSDPDARLVWLVAKGVARAYDTRTVRLVLAAQVPPFTDAAALDGRLYVISGDAVLAVGAGQPRARPILATRHQLAAITADSAHGRLVVADFSAPARLWLLTPRRYASAHIDRMATARLIKPSLGSARGAVWIAGFDTGGGVLLRLDATTLRTTARSSLDSVLEPGAIIAGSGASSIWVRQGDGGNLLRCVDAQTGRLRQSWPVSGPVGSAPGHAVIGTSFGAWYLGLRGCRG